MHCVSTPALWSAPLNLNVLLGLAPWSTGHGGCKRPMSFQHAMAVHTYSSRAFCHITHSSGGLLSSGWGPAKYLQQPNAHNLQASASRRPCKQLQQDSYHIAACILTTVLASLFIAGVSDAETPLQAGSAVVQTIQIGSETNTSAAVTAPGQAQAAGSTAKPQVL